MFKSFILFTTTFFIVFSICNGCLITNCPRGGKRSHNHAETAIKQCIACGPNRSGQCFGPNICCGPFGCLIGTPETIRCQQEGLFQEPEPCIAGSSYCRRNTGRCASDGVCCTQDSCHMDKMCNIQNFPLDSLYNLLPISLLNQADYGNEINNV